MGTAYPCVATSSPAASPGTRLAGLAGISLVTSAKRVFALLHLPGCFNLQVRTIFFVSGIFRSVESCLVLDFWVLGHCIPLLDYAIYSFVWPSHFDIR